MVLNMKHISRRRDLKRLFSKMLFLNGQKNWYGKRRAGQLVDI